MQQTSHTPLRNVRVNAATWEAAKAVAASRGESLSQVIRDALTDYVNRHATVAIPQTPGGKSSPGRKKKEQPDE